VGGKSGIEWVKTPDELARAIERFGLRAIVVAHAGAAYVGTRMQNHARRNAPWHDRTGNARGGLFFAVDGFGLEPVSGKGEPGKKPGAELAFRKDAALAPVEGGDLTTLVVYLGHTMSYGVSLELDHGEAYAIVWPTIAGVGIPEMQEMLQNLFKEL
jgi:hypothetical protein